jgi:hypothetical protein
LPVPDEPFDPLSLLEALAHADVDFVLIGCVAGGAHGSSYGTFDLDIAFAERPENVERLSAVLTGLGADPPSGDAAFGCETRFGRLDCYARPAGGPRYEALRAASIPTEVRGVMIHVASLDHLIAMGEAMGRPRDLLRATEYRTISDELRAPRDD